MKRILRYLGAYRKECVIGPLFKLLEASFELLVPLVVAAMVDQAIPLKDRGYGIRLSLILAGLGLVGFLCAVTAQYFAAKAACGFAKKLKKALFEHLQTLSHSEIDKVGTATLITRMTGDMNQLQTGVNMTIRLFLRSPFVVFGAMIMAFTIDVKSALVFAVTIPLLSVVVFAIILGCIPLYKKVQGKLDRLLATTRENLTGVRVIRAFGLEEREKKDFRRRNDGLTKAQVFVAALSALMNPLTYVILNGAILVLIYVGALRVQAGALTQGQVFALYNYMSQILVELVKLANLIVTMTKAVACGKRISAVFDVKSSLIERKPDKGEEQKIEEAEDKVVFKKVSLQYNGAGAESLSDIDFSVKKGSTVGIIGATGSGKSSLVRLIPRFYDVTRGQVLVDGRDVRSWSVEELRGKIGVVPQKAVLFRGSIRSNLLWGNPNATDEELEQALKMAQAETVVAQKGGLDARVEQGGRNFSGGQKQRLTIARALVRKPELLILDDSASALDFATDKALQKAIEKLRGECTVFMVSQRASSVINADLILVLDDGRVAGVGTHTALLENCPVYKEIFLSQSK